MSSRRVPWLRRGVLVAAGAALFILSLATSVPVGAYALPDRAFSDVGCPVGNYSCYYAKAGARLYGYYYVRPAVAYVSYAPAAYYGYGYGYRYTDTRFCGDGQVTATAHGYFCTTSGVPAYRSDGAAGYRYVVPYIAPYYYGWYR